MAPHGARLTAAFRGSCHCAQADSLYCENKRAFDMSNLNKPWATPLLSERNNPLDGAKVKTLPPQIMYNLKSMSVYLDFSLFSIESPFQLRRAAARCDRLLLFGLSGPAVIDRVWPIICN